MSYSFSYPPLEIAVKGLQEFLAGVIGNDLYAAFFADGRAVKAVFAVLDILEDRLLFLFVPADDIHKARLVAQLAADAF
jgi:hypothetical protein